MSPPTLRVTPQEAFRSGDRETLLYVPAVIADHSRPDYLATIDADPASPTYAQVIHRLPLGAGDELHHSGWNACSSCHGDPSRSRSLLILPALGSNRVYGVDVATNPRAPKLFKAVDSEEIKTKAGVSYLHTTHCLGSGEIMVSGMGDTEGGPKGAFLILDEALNVKGNWSPATTKFGYDFWYQPRLNVMVSSAWGAPAAFSKGFDPAEVAQGLYGSSLYVWNWEKREVVQTIDLGQEGLVPLEVRFLHEPSAPHGFVGAALSSNVIHFTRSGAGNGAEWSAVPVIKQPWLDVEGWVLPQLPPLITDILISLDDKYLYFSNWLRGDVVQYDISDPAAPKLAGRLWLGGVARRGGAVKVTGGLPEDVNGELPEVPQANGEELRGGPQMLQLSNDGKRLYVTNSLFSPWDKQFYGDMVARGSYLLKVDVDTESGGLTLDPAFYVDFGAEPDGPALAHEVRYGAASGGLGDCSSDIWL